MSAAHKCSRCDRELPILGAFLYGPPGADGQARKDPLCADCYNSFLLPLGRTLAELVS